MGKQKSASWHTLERPDEAGVLSKMPLPMNRKARKAYQKANKDITMLPPIMRPYVKPKEKTDGER